jgi:hypothetical protein
MTWEGVLISYNSQMEELEKRLKELRGFVAPWGMKHCQLSRQPPPPPAPEIPGTGPHTKEYTWRDPWLWPNM